jgi:hypothetical protein
VRYQRFVRRSAPTTLHVTAEGAGAAAPRLRVSRDYLSNVLVRSMLPEPDTTTVSEREVEYGFAGAPAPTRVIRLEVEPRTAGTVRGWIAFGADAPVAFSQFAYP